MIIFLLSKINFNNQYNKFIESPSRFYVLLFNLVYTFNILIFFMKNLEHEIHKYIFMIDS